MESYRGEEGADTGKRQQAELARPVAAGREEGEGKKEVEERRSGAELVS